MRENHQHLRTSSREQVCISFRAAVAAFLFFFSIPLSAQRVHLNDSYPVIQTANSVWIGAPSGLYRYNQADDSFRKYSIPSKHANPRVKFLYEAEDWLWCVLDTGLAGLQTEQNDWLCFDSANGLPSNDVRRLDFEEDYVWAATANGAARFDLLIEQWESIDAMHGLPEKNVLDIHRTSSHAWLLMEREFAEYDPRYEKWRRYPFEQSDAVHPYRLFMLDNELWIAAENGFLRFNPSLQSRYFFSMPFLSKENIIEAYIEGNILWVISKQGIYYYEKSSGVWKEFEGNNNLTYAAIEFGFVAPSHIWVLTKNGVMLWDRQTKSWQLLDYSSGLSAKEYRAAFCSGGFTVLFGSAAWDYRKTANEPWKKVLAEEYSSAVKSGDALRNLFDNPQGGSAEYGGYTLGFQGTRVSLLRDMQKGWYQNGSTPSPWNEISSLRADIKSQLDLGASRRILGFYNNVDYSETMYGVRYRGNDGDYLREFLWGDFQREKGADIYAEPAEVFGVMGWAQYGEKTQRFKRSEYALKAFSGELESRKIYEHFSGTAEEHQVTVRDVDYIRGQFFKVPASALNPQADGYQIFADDKNPTNNTANTLTGESIAGVRGDYDLLKAPEDWFAYRNGNILRITKYISPASTLVLRSHAARSEALLQNAGTSSALKNVYSLGSQQIVPLSLELHIYHANGTEIPLASFGIDGDGDGKPDAPYIDYERGILSFPADYPFALQVYGPSPVSTARIEARYRTEFSMIRLGHENLVRGSEVLRLDGVVAAGGNDYIIDYTNGSLAFVKEGVVNTDTKIEVEYSYYIDRNNPELSGASFAYSPSDNVLLQTGWQNISTDSSQLFTVQGEFRQSVSDFDIRFIPAAAYQSSVSAFTSASVETYISSPSLRLQSVYRRFEKEYMNLYRPQAVFGDIRSQASLSASLDILPDVRLTGDWSGSEGFRNTAGNLPYDRTASITALLHNPVLPGWQLTAYTNTSAAGGAAEYRAADKNYLQSALEYQLPASMTELLSLRNVRLENTLRLGSGNQGGTAERFFNSFYRANIAVTGQTQLGVFYRKNTSAGRDNGSRISGFEKALADIYFTEIRAVHCSFRMENTLQRHILPGGGNTYYLRQFLQANFRVNPGQFAEALSPLFFEVNMNQSAYQSGIGNASVWALPLRHEGENTLALGRNYYVKNEFRPNSDWFLYSMIELNTLESFAGASGMKTDILRLNEKLDYKFDTDTRLIAQYKQTRARGGYAREENTYEPSSSVERRWTSNFSNILNVLYRRKNSADGAMSNSANDYGASVDFQFRGYEVFLIRALEIRQSFGGTYRQSSLAGSVDNFQFTTSSSIDVFPLHSLIVRFRFDYGAYNETDIDTNDYSTLSFSLKVTLQM